MTRFTQEGDASAIWRIHESGPTRKQTFKCLSSLVTGKSTVWNVLPNKSSSRNEIHVKPQPQQLCRSNFETAINVENLKETLKRRQNSFNQLQIAQCTKVLLSTAHNYVLNHSELLHVKTQFLLLNWLY